MNRSAKLKIIEVKNVIDDHLLDIIGNEFKFDHPKGLAEWLKNSVSAYIRVDVPDSEQYVIFRFMDGGKDDAVLECIDFAGMDEIDIEKAFKRWGDPEAARRGLKKRVYGGHGNGGKFYMRQMFDRSHFFTYKNGRLNVFGFSENKKYGFAEGFQNVKIKPAEALVSADLDGIIFPADIKKLVLAGKTGFTVVRGVGPAGMKNKIRFERIVEGFKSHPQGRRILSRISAWATHNNSVPYIILRPDEIKPLPGFEELRIVGIPPYLPAEEYEEKRMVEMSNKKFPAGRLVLRTSEEAFGKGSRLADLNRIDIIGELGVIASYQIWELGVTSFPQASFIYGECECAILEDPDMDSVRNDRSKLVDNPRSKALLIWIRDRIEELANEIAAKERTEQEAERKRISDAYNEYLNQWKDRLMRKILGELFRVGASEEGNGGGGRRGSVLTVPQDGFAFTFPEAEIATGESEKITLKASVPDPIPVGSIVSLASSNPLIETDGNEITLRSDNVRMTSTGEQVAVLNFFVTGQRAGEEGKITASVGKRRAEILLRIVEGSGGDKTKKPKSPRVLLSNISPDPLNLDPNGTVTLSGRDPLVYQRPQDVDEGIYWINTQSPLAQKILEQPFGDHSIRWRDYLFQRYVDIFIKAGLYELQKRFPEEFRAERVDSEIMNTLVRRVHAEAVDDLGRFFFEEEFDPMAPNINPRKSE